MKDTNKLQLHARLRALAEAMPPFALAGRSSPTHLEWLTRVRAAVARWDPTRARDFPAPRDCLWLPDQYLPNAVELLYTAIAELELEIPDTPGLTFAAGDVYDFFKALREVFGGAKADLLVIDPYLDDKVFDAYLADLKPPVGVRLLVRNYAPAVKPAAER
ncbi:MAG: hypothetical protein K2X82_06105 [Gemmataceae bacterium]|nr:hypothetical protein [Gemmataceae bacterium]